MAKTRVQKEQALADYQDGLKRAKSVVFVNFDKLKVKEIEQLRKQCRAENIGYVVAKKTLMKLAMRDAGLDSVNPKAFDNSVATVFGFDDEVAPARVVQTFAKDHEALKTIGGILEGSYVDRERVLALATLPSKQELLGKLVGTIQAPVSGFVNVLAGNLRGLLYALNAIKESKSN